MKKLQTEFKTGGSVLRNGKIWEVGNYLPDQRKIKISHKTGQFSQISDYISTRELNKLQKP